jgi:putative transposase
MRPPPLTPQPERHHLPRLAREHYCGFAAVLWTLTLDQRAVGWLDFAFHARFRELLLHAAIRQQLACPAYVLMPDHIHVVWLGVKASSDQLNGMRFLRQHLQCELTRRSTPQVEFALQKQAHDSVLRQRDRTRGAFGRTCFYVLDNPRRQGLAAHPRQWPYLGAVVAGFPSLHPLDEGFWPAFWKIYTCLRAPGPVAVAGGLG